MPHRTPNKPAIPAVDRELLRRLPKAELHCHLDGSVRPQTLIDLGREHGVTMPRSDATALADYMRVDDARNLEDYLARFSTTLSVMQTAPALERIAFELAEDAAAEGVRYIEARYAPVLNVRGGLTLDEAVEATIHGLARAEQAHGIVGRVIVCALRNHSPKESMELSELAVAYRTRGVVGFDLAGGEAGNPAADHKAAFANARRHDMACTCHAGEGDGPDSVREAVHVCGANRIGHATHLIEDKSLTQYVNDRRIALEICLTSNVQTRATSGYSAHPLREYFDRGLNVVLNTDNRLMSGVNLTDEYEHAVRDLGFTFDELCEIAINGFASAFVEYGMRERMIADARQAMAALKREVPA
ncbi:MAG TPA: adenosine deaminase [Gemmatimonadaceae bacterium]|nr:adenosine deaminase [Gemmatimonadaceae bacterium]